MINYYNEELVWSYAVPHQCREGQVDYYAW